MADEYYSIKRHGDNSDYLRQNLPFADSDSVPGITYRAGTEVGGQHCPRCPIYIAVTSKVIRLEKPENKKIWIHARCEKLKPRPPKDFEEEREQFLAFLDRISREAKAQRTQMRGGKQ